MARKSRKRQTVTLPHLHSETAGYIRLSVTGMGARKPASHIAMVH